MLNKLTKPKKSSTVSNSLMPRIKQKKAEKKADLLKIPDFASLDPKGLFDIPWKDVSVFLDGAANPSKENLIYLGPDALVAMKRLYAEYGVTGLPTTWGQFMGSISYCTELQAACGYERMGAVADAEWFAAVIKVAKRYSPELVPAINALDVKNMEGLRKYFIEEIGFEKCSWHFDSMIGWVSFPASRPTKPLR
jgi:hypothetical protein